jgi:hypothetical protein
MSFFNRMALLSASAIAASSIGLGAIPAHAATAPASTARPDAIGAVVCSGNLCIQTSSCPTSAEVAINEWASPNSFYGHFELEVPDGLDYNTNDMNWTANIDVAEFIVPLFLDQGYRAVEWAYFDGTYINLGAVNFTVNNC